MSTINLYQMRCAVATLVCAVSCGGRLDIGGVRQVDTAVAVLSAARRASKSGRAVGDAIDRLLATSGDPDGARTIAAIDELAKLTHVESSAAPALAARLRPEPVGQRRLFDPDEAC